MASDFDGVVRKVAAIGYAGVETAGFNGSTPQKAAALFKSLGLEVSSAHGPLPVGDKKNEVLDTMGALGCKRLVCPWLPPERFQTVDGIKAVCEELNAANEVARANGLTLFYHNHWFEYGIVDGQRVSQIMLKHLAPTVKLEVDTYWVKVGGADIIQVLQDVGGRAPLLHLKDGPAENKDQPMVAVGDGVMDWSAIARTTQNTAEWFIVELDRCATDMLTAVQKSYAYLVGKGFARGNKS
jgi:sugar phosphate isomerase/epimerase